MGETMDTERFQKNIEQADSNSLRIGAANRVLQQLQKLRYSNKLQLLLMKETKRLYLNIMERLFP